VQRLRRLDQDDPKELDERKIDKAYRARLRMVLSLDEMIAGLVKELRVTDELKNTYVFFTSDNGYHLGEHWLNLTKRTPYEEAHKVPLVARGPGVPAGRTVEEMALNIDVAPTFAELGGLPHPRSSMAGR
jgi:N-acetylglucosamine-6-sulfatase